MDAEKQRCKVTAEINDRNGDPSFSMSWEVAGSMGQCDETMKPRTDAQRKLLELWNRWHLNTLHAGTPEQEEALKKVKLDWYDAQCEHLKSIWLLVVKHPKTWEDYTYWTARLTEDLPVDLWQEVEDAMDTITEEEKTDEKVTEDTEFTEEEEKEISNMYDGDIDKPIALAILHSVTKWDLMDWSAITNDRGNYWSVYWTDYLFGTDNEMDNEWDEALESYIDDCILPELNENYRQYFDNEGWKSDARMDGRWHTLNRYDWGEDDITYNWVVYYCYQQ